jgi:glycosyltransferase involved in cell wall biosynthesis
LLRRADLLTTGPSAASRLRALGVAERRLAVVPPAVLIPAEVSPAKLPAIPEEARVLLCVGPFENHKGYRDAIWAFDILKYLYDDLYLLLVGTGPDRGRLEHFTGLIKASDRVRFLGPRADLTPVYARADIVWVPSRSAGGTNTVLEAMAAGRPVVASRLPELAALVAGGETGLLVPPGDKVALARQTRQLLDDAGRRQQMGEAGRRRAAEHFPAARLVEGMARLYDDTVTA